MKLQKHFYIIFLIFTLIDFGPLSAQCPNLAFNHLTNEQGLSQNTVTSILKDHYGFIWIGTQSGLNRFDGYEIINFFKDPFDSTTISNNLISCLIEDKNQNLWIGTSGGGICRYIGQSNSFKRYPLYPSFDNILEANDIYAFCITPDSDLYVASGHGLWKFNETTDSFIQYVYPIGLKDVPIFNIQALSYQSDSILWLGTYHHGLKKFNINSKLFDDCSRENSFLTINEKIWSLMTDSRNNLWVGTETNGITKINASQDSFIKIQKKTNAPNGLQSNFIRTIVEDSMGFVWIGSEGGGLHRYNPVNGTLCLYQHSPFIPSSLALYSIPELMVSDDNILWLGLADAGLDRTQLSGNIFTNYYSIPGGKSSLSNKVINAFAEDSKGNLWIGTEQGLNCLSLKSGNVSSFFVESGILADNVVTSLCFAKNNELWIGGYIGGISIYNTITKKTKYLVHNPEDLNSLSSNFVRHIFPDIDGTFWIGTIRGGLDHYFPAENKFIHYQASTLDHSVNNNFIMRIVPDRDNNLWIATFGGGLNFYNRKTEKFRHFIHEDKDSSSLSDNQVISVYVDAKNQVWCGTSNGLNRLNPADSTFTKWFTSHGLPNNTINGIQEDIKGNLWVITNKGLARINAQQNGFTNYYEFDGLIGEEFNYNTIEPLKNGEIALGSVNGLSLLNPEIASAQPNLDMVKFTQLSVTSKSKSYVKNIPANKELHFLSSDELISLHFSTFYYSSIQKVEYQYFLEKINSGWINLGHKNFVTFNSLPHGKNKLKVRARLAGDEWGSDYTWIWLIKTPPLYARWWFIALNIVFALLLVYFFYALRIYRIKRQKEELESMVETRTIDLQEANVMMEEQQSELEMQKEEIIAQRDLAEIQKEKIEKQHLELQNYRNHLEELIQERTLEYILAKEEAEKADKLKTAFLANMSHEIRTPMNAIIGFIQLLQYGNIEGEDRDQYMELIVRSGERLMMLIDDLIDLAKIESGQLKIYKKEIIAENVLKDIYYIFQQKIVEKGNLVELNYQKFSTQTIIFTDGHRLSQVLTNLLDNALKFTESGKISFGYSINNDNYVRFFVSDTGIGIPTHEQENIFNRFIKLEQNANKLYGGTGLGLAICREIISLLGGEIGVESNPGMGSAFWFTIPLSNEVKD